MKRYTLLSIGQTDVDSSGPAVNVNIISVLYHRADHNRAAMMLTFYFFITRERGLSVELQLLIFDIIQNLAYLLLFFPTFIFSLSLRFEIALF